MLEPEFSYDVKISEGSVLLGTELFGSCFPRVTEMVITSKQFAEYDECANALTSLLAVMAATNTQITERNHVIVTKANPALTDPPGKIVPEERWEGTTLLRAFVADADALKSSKLRFEVMGQIKVATESAALIRSVQGKLQQ